MRNSSFRTAALGDPELGQIMKEGDQHDENAPDIVHRSDVGQAKLICKSGRWNEDKAEQGPQGGLKNPVRNRCEKVKEDQSQPRPDGANDREKTAAHVVLPMLALTGRV
jgi:hypothetical protein